MYFNKPPLRTRRPRMSQSVATVIMSGPTAAGHTEPPAPAEVLRRVGEAAPALWFLSDIPADRRDAVRAVVWELCRTGQLEVGDWVAGRGQGFRRTSTAAVVESPAAVVAEDPESVRRPLLSPRPSVVTPLLVVVHVVWYLVGWVGAAQAHAVSDYLKGTNHPIVDPILLRAGGVSAPTLLAGEWWRLPTSQFAHVGLFHLFGNVVVLALLGTLAEAVWGRWRFLLIYLTAGLSAAATAMALHPLGGLGDVEVYGSASGGLWGVTVAVLAWMARNLSVAPPAAATDCVRRVVVVGVMNLVVSFAQGVSVGGLLGGAAGGLAVAFFLARLGPGRAERRLAMLGLVLTAAAFAGLLTAAVYISKDWQTVRQRVAPPPVPTDASDPRP